MNDTRAVSQGRCHATVTRLLCAVAWLLASSACLGGDPEIVWVPDEGFSATLAIDVELPEGRAVRVGDALALHAVRETGPWKQASLTTLEPDACWLVRPPDPVENEVQASVRWIAEPAGPAVFNLPQVQDLKRRTVTFRLPGTYSLRARADAWCGPPVDSETIEIVVVAPGGAP